MAFWTLPSTLSALPSDCSFASPAALPMAALTEPLISFAAPAIRSLSMTTCSCRGHKSRNINPVHQCDRIRTVNSGGRLGKYLVKTKLPGADRAYFRSRADVDHTRSGVNLAAG